MYFYKQNMPGRGIEDDETAKPDEAPKKDEPPKVIEATAAKPVQTATAETKKAG